LLPCVSTPAAVMSIGAANLFTRNFWKAYVQPGVTSEGEAKVAKLVSLVVKVGALVIILVLPTKFALDLQLLGGVWILQTFPAVVFGLFFNWFRAPALLLGWAVGLVTGTSLVFLDGVKPVHSFLVGGDKVSLYTGLFALAVNIVVAAVAQGVLGDRGSKPVAQRA
jgi:SSS family solute:Na+ symporter